jgi:cell division protein FtsL
VNAEEELEEYQNTTEHDSLYEVPKISHAKEKNLSVETLLYTYLVMTFGFLLLLPMIHIKNQIYYYSRDISVLWSEYSILVEENKDLNQKIETIRFKHHVLDAVDVK